MKNGDYVMVKRSGHTGRVYQVRSDGYVRVTMATGAHAGQIRTFRADSLRPS